MNTKLKPSIPQTRQPKEIRTPEGMIPFTPPAVAKYIEQQYLAIKNLNTLNTEVYKELEELKKKLEEPKAETPDAVISLLNQAKKQISKMTEATSVGGFNEDQARKYQCLIDLIVELRP